MNARSLVALAALTGFCGLGSETLFFKLLDHSIGSAPPVRFVVVATFIVGMGAGAVASPWFRKPWKAEAALAVYYIGWLTSYDTLVAVNATVVAGLGDAVGANAACAAVGVVYLAPPAFLLGVTLPAIIERRSEVAAPYAWHTLGAIAAVVAVESALYPRWGLAGCLAVLAGAHAVAAVALSGRAFHFSRRSLRRPPPALVVAGIGTGAFQGVWLFQSELLYQPFYFVQPVVVASMLAGISGGAALWRVLRWSFSRTLLAAAAGVALSTVATAALVRVAYPGSFAPMLWQLPLGVGIAAVPVGALFPAYVADGPAARDESGAALLGLAVGNAIGIGLAMSSIIALPVSVALAASSAPLLIVALRGRPRAWIISAVVACVAIGAAVMTPDATYLRRLPGHADRPIEVEQWFRAPGELSAIYRLGGVGTSGPERRIYQSGYSPIVLDMKTESVIAAVGAAYTPYSRRALVLGAGSGRSAGAAALVFDHVDVVDLGGTVRDLLGALGDENYGLLDRDNARYWDIDGVVAPYVLGGDYDLIVLTVDPGYHARAAKLYTAEYLRAVRGMLAPGGVLVFWSDMSFGAEGNQVLINTGQAVFAHQTLFAVFRRPGINELQYYLLVHSDAPLEFSSDRHALTGAFPPDTAAGKRLAGGEPEYRLRGRAHMTTEIHSTSRPARSILVGGYAPPRHEPIPLTAPR